MSEERSERTGVILLAFLAAAAMGGGAYWLTTLSSTDPQDTPSVAAAGPAPVVAPAPQVAPDSDVPAPVAEAPAPQAAEAPAEDAQPDPPRIDEVRVEQSGLFVIAGRAAPGSTVRLLLDGAELTQARTNGTGAFAAVGQLGPSDAARVLTLVQFGPDGAEVAGADDLILAPVAPVVAQTSADPASGTSEDTQLAEAKAADEDSDAAPITAQANTGVSDTAALQADATDDEGGAASLIAQNAENGEAPVAGPLQTTASDAEAVADAGTTAHEAASTTADAGSAEAQVPAADQPAEIAVLTAPAVPAPAVPTPSAPDTAQVAVPQAPGAPTGAANAAASLPHVSAQTPAPSALTLAPALTAPTTRTAEAPAPRAPQAEQPRPEANQLAVLRSDPDGVRLVTRSQSPAVMDTIALDTIGYSEAGEVQLAGRARPEAAEVRVYLDNTNIATLPVADNGNWGGELPEIATGVYTLRVDQVSATGDVTSRIETPFQRTDPSVLDAARDGPAPASAITVQSGATLWAIARARYGEGVLYVRVFEANRDSIRDPDLIYPGQIFTLPD